MKIIFTHETTLDLFNKLNFLTDLSDLLSEYSFGKGIENIYVCLHSLDPEFGINRDFETGLIIHKKYTSSRKTLEFSYKLNHRQMTEAHQREEVLVIIQEGFKKTFNEIKALKIKDFNIDDFYSVVSSTIEYLASNDYESKEKIHVLKSRLPGNHHQ